MEKYYSVSGAIQKILESGPIKATDIFQRVQVKYSDLGNDEFWIVLFNMYYLDSKIRFNPHEENPVLEPLDGLNKVVDYLERLRKAKLV